jgi:arylsulfatase A
MMLSKLLYNMNLHLMCHRIYMLRFALMIVAGLALAGCSKKEALPNIVIILVDDMGYGDPGCYNPQSKIPTPNIDQLALEGMRFTDAHSAGALCHPSRYGLLTGTYPFRTDVSVWRKKATIEEDQVTIASLLHSRGYHTAMVGNGTWDS